MDFIRVTLIEKHEKGKMSERQKMSDYLLPVAGIKSVSPKHNESGVYIIDIVDGYYPNGILFTVGNAEAKLPEGFVRVIN